MSGRLVNRQGSRRIFSLLLASGLFWSLATRSIMAQQGDPRDKPISPFRTTDTPGANPKPSAKDKQSADRKPQTRAFVIAPQLPISSPALGSGVVPVFAYIFPTGTAGKASPASLLGAVGLVTDNGSRAIALGGELYLKQNTYRTTAVYARGNLNYDLFGLGSGDSQPKLPLEQAGQLVFGEFLRRTWWKLFLGPRFLWGSSLITVRPNTLGAVPLPPDLGFHTTLTPLGFRASHDTRPNRFYPTEGTFLDLTADFFSRGPCIRLVRLLYRGPACLSTETAFTAPTASYAVTLPVAILIVTCLVRSWSIGWPCARGSALWGLVDWENSTRWQSAA
jgi:hypothetical protein